MKKIFVLVGESGSGKDTIAREVLTNNLSRVVTTTTRQIRYNESEGIDYYFITEDEFKLKIENNEFIEFNKFKTWYYGLTKQSLLSNPHDNLLLILNPSGLHSLIDYAAHNNIKLIPIYIYCDERLRLIRTLQRNDNVDEVLRRVYADREDFEDILITLLKHNGYLVKNEESLEESIEIVKGIISDHIG